MNKIERILNIFNRKDVDCVPNQITFADITRQAEIGKGLAEVLPEKAEIVYYKGLAGQEHYLRRENGFKETMAKLRSDVKIIAESHSGPSREEAVYF